MHQYKLWGYIIGLLQWEMYYEDTASLLDPNSPWSLSLAWSTLIWQLNRQTQESLCGELQLQHPVAKEEDNNIPFRQKQSYSKLYIFTWTLIKQLDHVSFCYFKEKQLSQPWSCGFISPIPKATIGLSTGLSHLRYDLLTLDCQSYR